MGAPAGARFIHSCEQTVASLIKDYFRKRSLHTQMPCAKAESFQLAIAAAVVNVTLALSAAEVLEQ